MHLLFVKFVLLICSLHIFVHASQQISPTRVAFYGARSEILPSAGILKRVYYNTYEDGCALVLNDEEMKDLSDTLNSYGFFIENRDVKKVYLRGSSEIGCNIIFPRGVQGGVVIREEGVEFTGKVINGTLSDQILPSTKQSSGCCSMQ